MSGKNNPIHTETQAEKMIRENERIIEEEKKKDEKMNTKEGFIGGGKKKWGEMMAQKYGDYLMLILKTLATVFIFLWIPSYLWITLKHYSKKEGGSGNQIPGCDPFKPPYTDSYPGGKGPSPKINKKTGEPIKPGILSGKTHGFPYNLGTHPLDTGEGDFFEPQQIWANHLKDMWINGRNAFDNFLHLFKDLIGDPPPGLDPDEQCTPPNWLQTIKGFFGVFYVFLITFVFILVTTGALAKMFIGVWLGIPLFSAFMASWKMFGDALRARECEDKAMGWFYSGFGQISHAKFWRLIYRAILFYPIFTINYIAGMVLMPIYGLWFAIWRPLNMKATRPKILKIVYKLMSKYYLPIFLFILFSIATWSNNNLPGADMLTGIFQPASLFNVGRRKKIENILKLIACGIPLLIGLIFLIFVIINLFKKIVPWSFSKCDPEKHSVDKTEINIDPVREWNYTDSKLRKKYSKEGYKIWMNKTIKENCQKVHRKCKKGEDDDNELGKIMGMAGQVVGAGIDALKRQPMFQAASGMMNMAASNPNVKKAAGMAATGAALLGSTGAAASTALGAGMAAKGLGGKMGKMAMMRKK